MYLSSPPSPPPLPVQLQTHRTHIHFNKMPTIDLPDFFFTAFSVFLLFSSAKPIASLTLHPNVSFSLNLRRFLKISHMAIPSTTTRLKNPNFPTPQSLSEWLKLRLPSDSFASWGVMPCTKNIHNLWLELSQGETSLADSSPPVRTVEVVVVRLIGKDNKVLVESHQELSNGDVRNRCQPLSKKLKLGEPIEAAASRAVKEEHGSVINEGFGSFREFDDDGIVKISPTSYTRKVDERVSESCPGLPACYVLHTMDATVEDSPEGEFCTEEAEEYENSAGKRVADGAVACKNHYWKWVDSYSS